VFQGALAHLALQGVEVRLLLQRSACASGLQCGVAGGEEAIPPAEECCLAEAMVASQLRGVATAESLEDDSSLAGLRPALGLRG